MDENCSAIVLQGNDPLVHTVVQHKSRGKITKKFMKSSADNKFGWTSVHSFEIVMVTQRFYLQQTSFQTFFLFKNAPISGP